MRTRKPEREAMRNILNQPNEDIEDVLQQAAGACLDAFMTGREFFVIAMQAAEGQTAMFGPYLTKIEAEKALKNLASPLPWTPARAGVWKLHSVA